MTSPPPPSSSSSDPTKLHKEKDETALEPPSLRTIETALKLVDSKKENLKRAYDQLRLCFPSTRVVPFSWAHLDSHFSSLHRSLSSRFLLLLNSYDPDGKDSSTSAPPDPDIHENATPPNEKDSTFSGPDLENHENATRLTTPDEKDSTFADPSSGNYENATPLITPEEKGSAFAVPSSENHENSTRVSPDAAHDQMDGKGLRKYVVESAKGGSFIHDEVDEYLRRGRDPWGMVVDAVEGFGELPIKDKKACLVILEALVRVKPEGRVDGEVRERARKFGLEWMESANSMLGASTEALALLNLVAGFGLAKEMDSVKLVMCCAAVSKHDGAPALVKEIGLDDTATANLIQKLIEGEKQLMAVKFICELGLADKFRPVDILTTYLKKLKKHRNYNCKEGKLSVASKNHIRSQEISMLELAIKIIDKYKLSYQKAHLYSRIALLEKQKDDELCAPPPDKSFRKQIELEKNQETHSQNGNKRPRTSTGPAPSSNAWRPSPQVAQFPGATPYPLPGNVSRYAGPPTGHYQMPMDAAMSHLYPRPPYMPSLPFGEFHPPYPNYQPYYPQ